MSDIQEVPGGFDAPSPTASGAASPPPTAGAVPATPVAATICARPTAAKRLTKMMNIHKRRLSLIMWLL